MTVDVVLVIILCALFSFAGMGGVTTAAFVWAAYQKHQIDVEVGRVRDEAARMYGQLRLDYERLKHDYESLRLKYDALSEVVMGKSPEVSIHAEGNIDVREFVGRDRDTK